MFLALWETNEALNEIENGIFRGLAEAMRDCCNSDDDRWCVLRAESALFSKDGLYHTYALRHFRGQIHFKLPLLGERVNLICYFDSIA